MDDVVVVGGGGVGGGEEDYEDAAAVVVVGREPKQLEDDGVVIVGAAVQSPTVDCSAPLDRGPCFNEVGSYYYDPREAKCVYFVCSGCGGNSNR